jgi:hypothetical protein
MAVSLSQDWQFFYAQGHLCHSRAWMLPSHDVRMTALLIFLGLSAALALVSWFGWTADSRQYSRWRQPSDTQHMQPRVE